RVHYRLAGPDVARLYELVRTVASDRIADVERARDDYLHSGRAPSPETPAADEEVTRAELLTRAAAGPVIVRDVRPTEEYAAAHTPGALSIPLDDLARRIDELPADQEIVAYCRGAYCVLAYEAVDVLRASGRRARRLQDGMLEWRLTEMPVDSGRAA